MTDRDPTKGAGIRSLRRSGRMCRAMLPGLEQLSALVSTEVDAHETEDHRNCRDGTQRADPSRYAVGDMLREAVRQQHRTHPAACMRDDRPYPKSIVGQQTHAPRIAQ